MRPKINAVGKKVQHIIPLSRIDKNIQVKLKDVMTWFHQTKEQNAARQVALVGDPNAPNDESLQTELQWLVEDSITTNVDWTSIWNSASSSKSHKLLSEVVSSKLDISHLQELWSYRVEERFPIQYILGECSWYDLELSVGPGVLIPRPETEILLDFALKALSDNPQLSEKCWLDLGTGSGALAIGLARHSVNDLEVLAVDDSVEACAYARQNIVKYNLERQVTLQKSFWFEGLSKKPMKFGGIVSNPPYIREEEMASLQAEVRLHEPHRALDGGPDNGLRDLKHIVDVAPLHLTSKGFLGLETGGSEQSHQLKALMQQDSRACFDSIQVQKDLRGIERFVIAKLK